ncbi:MAG TPA: HAD family hydrolase [Ktedonobacterales bacterium]
MRDGLLFLFDIDGTLLRRMPPAHRHAISDAAQEVYGVTLAAGDMGSTAGMTDTAIIRRVVLSRGVTDAALWAGLPAFFESASIAYTRHVPADLRAYHTPFAGETLAWLAERGASLGLVTGNIEGIAWTKLKAAGIADYFRCGAFGDEAELRDSLPPLALARAQAVFARDFTPEQVYVVGDTPADIQCGAASGLRTIGVATGPEHSLDHLRACSPTSVFDDLRGLRTLEER